MPYILSKPELGVQKPRLQILSSSTSAPAGWQPSDKSGLQFWFKADAITGLSNGDPVSTWIDSSGNGNDASQTGTNRGTYTVNVVNGKPGVTFANASNQFMEFGTNAFCAKGSPFSVIFVGYTAIGVNQFRTFFSVKGSATDACMTAFESTNASYQNFNYGFSANGGQVGWRSGASSQYTAITFGICIYDGTNSSAQANWSSYKATALATPIAVAGNLNNGGNNRNLIGQFPSAAAGLGQDGPAVELFAYNSVMSAADLTNLNSYMLTKYNLS